MAEQRPFRFRLPWLSAPAPPPPRPAGTQPPRPAVEIQAPPRPTTTVPIQRPTFRPAGIAPAQPPAIQTPAQEITQPQTASPRRATTESQVTSRPTSPSRATIKTQTSSVPASPSQQTRAVSVPPSPSRAAPLLRAVSVPPPPPRTIPQTRPEAPTVPKPQSPSKTAGQVQPTLQMLQPKAEIPAEAVLKPQPQAELTQALIAETTATPSAAPALETPVKEEKKTEEQKEVMEDTKREEKTDGPGKQVKELLDAAKQRLKEDIFERKKATTISTNGETTRTVRSRYALGESHKKPGMPNGEKVPLHKEIREDISKFVHKLGMEHIKHPIGDKPVSIITLAGENKGASMYVGYESARKDGSIHIHRGYKINPDESTEATTDGEGSSKGRRSKDLLSKEDPAAKAFINSNAQCVNNSILLDSSVNERSPGVKLSLSNNKAEPDNYGTKPGPLESHKAEFQVTPAEKLTYEPTVKRRCLRGLFLESSDSDPDNPEKPRRHGCHYGCGQKTKDKDIGVL